MLSFGEVVVVVRDRRLGWEDVALVLELLEYPIVIPRLQLECDSIRVLVCVGGAVGVAPAHARVCGSWEDSTPLRVSAVSISGHETLFNDDDDKPTLLPKPRNSGRTVYHTLTVDWISTFPSGAALRHADGRR